MMVRPTSRIFSAISFGVFCRSAPHQRDHAVEEGRPGAAVMRTRSNPTAPGCPGNRGAVAAQFADDRRGFARDRASLTDAMPSITSPSHEIMSPASTSTTSPT